MTGSVNSDAVIHCANSFFNKQQLLSNNFRRMLLCLLLTGYGSGSYADSKWWPFSQHHQHSTQTRIKETYVDLYTGPNRGYPIRNVLSRDDTVNFIKSHSDWFQVENNKGERGWIALDDLTSTFERRSNSTSYLEALRDNYRNLRLYFGVSGGTTAGTPTVGRKVGLRINPFFSTEFNWNNATGDQTSRTISTLNLIWHPFEFGSLEPHFLLGFGRVKERPSQSDVSPTTIVIPIDPNTTSLFLESDEAVVGLGVSWPLSKRFLIQSSFKNHFVFTSSEQQRSLQEWQLGFAFYLGSEAGYVFNNLFQRKIDGEDFAIGFYTGSYSIEDFSAEPTFGVFVNYHISENHFVSLSHASVDISDASYRNLGLAVLDTPNGAATAPLHYYSAAIGFNILPGEIVFNGTNTWRINVHTILGVGTTEFQNRDIFTLELGLGLALNISEKYSLNIDFRDHVYEQKLLGQEKTTNNLETRIGLSRRL